ncbi:MAG: RHS repeat-associated core domain-containing protein [Flavobacteriales bacterium]
MTPTSPYTAAYQLEQSTNKGYFYTYVTNTSQNIVAFDNMVVKRWAPKVRAVYDYYPFGLTWENPKLPDDPAGVHDHTYQDKEFQFAEFSTGHGLALCDFHARMYDPATGRWLVPDPAEQFANPYLAMGNNPVMDVDPDGEFILVAVGIGAAIGAYTGHQIGKANGAEGWAMAGYMVGGAVIGGLSGAASYSVATAGIAFANTASIATGSFTSSMGMNILSGGQTDVNIGFGVASYNVSQNQWGYLGKGGNSTSENIGFGLGALANAADILAGFKPGSVELRTENDPNFSKTLDIDGNPIYQKDKIGHSQLTDGKGNTYVDWGPNERMRGYMKSIEGTNTYEMGLVPSSKMKWDPLTIEGVNTGRISNWSPSGKYNLCFNSCVTQTSRALNSSGVFNVGIHPYLLHAQMYLRSIGLRPYLFSSYLYQD